MTRWFSIAALWVVLYGLITIFCWRVLRSDAVVMAALLGGNFGPPIAYVGIGFYERWEAR